MSTNLLRDQLRQQIERVPDELLLEIADFVAFVLARRQKKASYSDWNEPQWRDFAIGQFLRETEDDVDYTLDDAQEVFHP
jgi:hypothetical protein